MIGSVLEDGEVTAMPLSEYEQRVLEQLEAQLASEDPELGSRLAAAGGPRRGRIALGVAAVMIGLSVLVLGMVLSQVWVSLIGFLAMFAGAYFAFSSPKSGRPRPGNAKSSAKKPPKPGLSDRFQRRVDGDGPI
ncbi:MAG: DUF3040 domain-containing protein [Bifidobacteriaceae bacterium]|jgi:hypothetical protein|nr:DUF3040 domain-containing protein [Bifidobacteriaceae bacterium]